MEVACAAGVSRATVSIVFNDVPHQRIPDTTRQRVMYAAATLGYAPSAAACTLRDGRFGVVVGLLPDRPLGYSIAKLLHELTLAFASRSLTVTVNSGMLGSRSLGEVWRALAPTAVLAFEESADGEASAIQAAGVEVIVAMYDTVPSRSPEHLSGASMVGAIQARQLAAAHRCLGYADGERAAVFTEPRLRGVGAVRAELDLPERDVRKVVPREPGAAVDTVSAWLAANHPVAGICAFNDEVAVAVLSGLWRLRLEAPEDTAVVGVENTLNAAVACRSLTSVAQAFVALACRCAKAVTAAFAGEPAPADPVEHRMRLEVRGSG